MKQAIYQSKILFSPNKYTLGNKIFTEKQILPKPMFSGFQKLHIITGAHSIITKNFIFSQKSTWQELCQIYEADHMIGVMK